MKVLFLFGPNLGALGRRDPATYGSETLEEIMDAVAARGATLGHTRSHGGTPITRAISSGGCSRPATRGTRPS